VIADPGRHEISRQTAIIRSGWSPETARLRSVAYEQATERLGARIRGGGSKPTKIPKRRCAGCGASFTRNDSLSLHLAVEQECRWHYIDSNKVFGVVGFRVLEGSLYTENLGVRLAPKYIVFGIGVLGVTCELAKKKTRREAEAWIRQYDPHYLASPKLGMVARTMPRSAEGVELAHCRVADVVANFHEVCA